MWAGRQSKRIEGLVKLLPALMDQVMAKKEIKVRIIGKDVRTAYVSLPGTLRSGVCVKDGEPRRHPRLQGTAGTS